MRRYRKRHWRGDRVPKRERTKGKRETKKGLGISRRMIGAVASGAYMLQRVDGEWVLVRVQEEE